MNQHNAAQQDRFTQWYSNHLNAFLSSLQELLQKPFASLMTSMVIGIAIALPFGLYVLLQNLQGISQHWDNQASISLYLKKGTPDFKITDLLHRIQKQTGIQKAKYISPQQGLRDFQTMTRFGNLLKELKQNPLPGVITIMPTKSYQSPDDVKMLLNHFQKLPLVDVAQMDFAWVKRLYFIITIGKRITYSLALLFGLGVLLVIGNTIRLTIEHHQEEMTILKLVGATDAFIQRPFLYRGLLYGLVGGFLAWLLVATTLSWLRPPAQALASSYSQHLLMQGLSVLPSLTLIFFSAGLGVIGAWYASRQQLQTLA